MKVLPKKGGCDRIAKQKMVLPSPQRERGARGEGDRPAVIVCLPLRVQQASFGFHGEMATVCSAPSEGKGVFAIASGIVVTQCSTLPRQPPRLAAFAPFD